MADTLKKSFVAAVLISWQYGMVKKIDNKNIALFISFIQDLPQKICLLICWYLPLFSLWSDFFHAWTGSHSLSFFHRQRMPRFRYRAPKWKGLCRKTFKPHFFGCYLLVSAREKYMLIHSQMWAHASRWLMMKAGWPWMKCPSEAHDKVWLMAGRHAGKLWKHSCFFFVW